MFMGFFSFLVFQVILILTKYYHAESTKVLESSLWRYVTLRATPTTTHTPRATPTPMTTPRATPVATPRHPNAKGF